MQQAYAVKHKKTGMFFAGFDAEKNPVWSAEERKARTYQHASDAKGQALLFVTFGIKVQQKPVKL